MSDTLRAAIDPRSIAVIGASDNQNKVGGRPLLYLRRFGYKGEVFPINPSRREVQGARCWGALEDLPKAPDMAVIAVPGEAAVRAIDDCARAGVKVAVMMTSGFAESDPVAGREQEQAMVARAHAGGMRIIGPNSQGLANFSNGAVPSFSTMLLEEAPADGEVAVLSQSGAMAVIPYGILRRRGIGVRHSHATGNDCDVTVSELATVVAEDPGVKLMLLYLEGTPDPKNLVALARTAHDRGLPVIALKGGRTAAGQAAAKSHTGSLASEDRVVDAFLDGLGIWRAHDMRGLVDATELYLKGWRPGGRRLVSISNSGAVCVLSADAASAAGLELPRLSDETQAELGKILPSFATLTNPVDITAALLTNSNLFGDILPVIAEDPCADAFSIGIGVVGEGYDVDAFARDSAAFAERTGKPLVASSSQPSVVARFAAQGVVTYPSESEAIGALAQYLSHSERMGRPLRLPGLLGPAPGEGEPVLLNEVDSLALLSDRGIPVVPHRLCRSREEAIEALRELGRPVAVKGCSDEVMHKSELGLVRLGLSEPDAVGEAFEAMRSILRAEGLRFDGVIVARMVRGRREMMIGAHRDPVFGPVVAVGDGGKYVETLQDVQLLLPPFAAADVEAALHRLRIAPILAGVRGEPPMNVAALAALVAEIGALMLDPAAGVSEIDLNPVMLGSVGEECTVLDSVVRRRC
jgi:acyl-CoA synthetase (NDP forming)